MGTFGWRIPALPYSLHELMTGEPKIRFPEATKPDDDGWWPAAHCDTPGGLGDVSALPSLKDAGITHPPSAKMARSKVSVIKDDRVELVDPPVTPDLSTPPATALGSAAIDIAHPPMIVTPGAENEAAVTDTPEFNGVAEDVTGAIKVAFTKEESEAILRKPSASDDPSSVMETSKPKMAETHTPIREADPVVVSQDVSAPLSNDERAGEKVRALATTEPEAVDQPAATETPVTTTTTQPKSSEVSAEIDRGAEAVALKSEPQQATSATRAHEAATSSATKASEQLNDTDDQPVGGEGITAKAEGDSKTSVTPKAPGVPAVNTQDEPTRNKEAPEVQDSAPTKKQISVNSLPARPAKAPKAPKPRPKRPEPEPEPIFNPKTMPISPPSPSIPGDDTDSLIVESFTESTDNMAHSSPFSTVPPSGGGRWGQSAKERRLARRFQQAIERNLDNSHAPLDVLFAANRGSKQRLMAMRPGFGRDFLVWLIAIIGVGQMLYRGWEILPTLNTFGGNISDFQILAAISLMVGGAISGVLALVAVRFITGMRSAVAWVISIFLVFGIFPWYGFGSQLSPTGLPPLPNPVDVVFNPVFDKTGVLSMTLIGLAICAVIATMSAFMVGDSKQS